jgi:pimeloyl-ACP methyl ester carboxylesterase
MLANYRAEKEEGKPQVLEPPASERLHELKAPLLVLLGTLDEPGTTQAMRHLAATVPGARLEELESAHMLNLEHPERFVALLREHFERA